jgi:hypothetical protein
MLGYDQFMDGKFMDGKFWMSEYGSARDPEQFKWLYAYSPYQHVKQGTKYPAVLPMTGDGDRVLRRCMLAKCRHCYRPARGLIVRLCLDTSWRLGTRAAAQ